MHVVVHEYTYHLSAAHELVINIQLKFTLLRQRLEDKQTTKHVNKQQHNTTNKQHKT